jgi:ABC-type hemin transport system substrate-binding protein
MNMVRPARNVTEETRDSMLALQIDCGTFAYSKVPKEYELPRHIVTIGASLSTLILRLGTRTSLG